MKKGQYTILGNGTSLIKNLSKAIETAQESEFTVLCNAGYLWAPLFPNLKFIGICDKLMYKDFWHQITSLCCKSEAKFWYELTSKVITHPSCNGRFNFSIFDKTNTGLHCIREALVQGAEKIICYGFDKKPFDVFGPFTQEQIDCIYNENISFINSLPLEKQRIIEFR